MAGQQVADDATAALRDDGVVPFEIERGFQRRNRPGLRQRRSGQGVDGRDVGALGSPNEKGLSLFRALCPYRSVATASPMRRTASSSRSCSMA